MVCSTSKIFSKLYILLMFELFIRRVRYQCIAYSITLDGFNSEAEYWVCEWKEYENRLHIKLIHNKLSEKKNMFLVHQKNKKCFSLPSLVWHRTPADRASVSAKDIAVKKKPLCGDSKRTQLGVGLTQVLKNIPCFSFPWPVWHRTPTDRSSVYSNDITVKKAPVWWLKEDSIGRRLDSPLRRIAMSGETTRWNSSPWTTATMVVPPAFQWLHHRWNVLETVNTSIGGTFQL